MKKNAMLKIAAILMVAVLLTTCAISSTFAKYTTSGTGTTYARVAKFGITIDSTVQVAGFQNEYDAKTGTIKAISASENVMAPGAYGSISSSNSVTGTAEVAVVASATYTISLDKNAGDFKLNGAEYFPIVFTVGSTDYSHKSIGGTYETISALLTAVSEAASVSTGVIAPGAAVEFAAAQTLKWAWAYEVDDDTQVDAFDAKDTELAKLAADQKIIVDVVYDVTQVEVKPAA